MEKETFIAILVIIQIILFLVQMYSLIMLVTKYKNEFTRYNYLAVLLFIPISAISLILAIIRG